MLDPFRLFGGLILAMFQIAGYTLVFLLQIVWFLLHRRSDKIGDAFGLYGREVIDAFASIAQPR
jgi:hypothetical protein